MSTEPENGGILALISMPRTGTNFLCSLLNHHPAITSHFEVFSHDKFHSGAHNNPERIIEYINQTYSCGFVDSDDINLITWIHSNPSKLIEALVRFKQRRHISFKLFPNQLEDSVVTTAIAKNTCITKVIIKRNLLDSFISLEIVRKTKQWDNFDTSNVSVSLSVNKFNQWVKRANEWYALFENEGNRTNGGPIAINYEDIHAHENNLEKLKYINRFLSAAGLDVSEEDLVSIRNDIGAIRKQDSRVDLAEKISNYRQFVKKAERKGLAHHLSQI